MGDIGPSIILQLLTAVVPALERLAREGDAGRQQIIQYGLIITISIVSRLPGASEQAINMFRQGAASPFLLVAMLGLAFLV